jgi:glycosyltransferase involved in cell wall biosynthesis
MRLAVLTTHPIQYNAPLFRELAQRPGLDVHVFYGWEGTENATDVEFGRRIAWDIPLLDGYNWTLVPNIAADPGTHHFQGLDNPQMNERIKEWRPDAILVYGWAWLTHLRAMLHFKGRVPVLFRGDSTLMSSRTGSIKRLLRRPALIWTYRHIDVALSPGSHNRAYFRAMGVTDARIRHVPHAIDRNRFDPEDAGAQAIAKNIRRDAGIGHGETTFLFAGKLVPRKEVDTLIAAFRRLIDAGARARLLIAGDGPERPRLEALAQGAPGITFIGFRNQSEMPGVYLAGDVLVLPSRHETWGLALNEALSLGRLAIASDRVGSAVDLLAKKPYGRIFSCGSSTDLARAMSDILKDPGDIRDLGRLARSDNAAWSIPAAADAIEAVLSEFLDGPGGLKNKYGSSAITNT